MGLGPQATLGASGPGPQAATAATSDSVSARAADAGIVGARDVYEPMLMVLNILGFPSIKCEVSDGFK